MSYERKSLQLLGGGLNLLNPTDQLAAGDALQMLNWRVDQGGFLKSRSAPHAFLDFSGANPYYTAHPIHTIGRWGDVYYIGVWDALFRSTNLTAPLTFNLFATRFEAGSRIGLVPMNGRLWCMNRGQSGSDDGTTFAQWGITAPASEPHVAAGTVDPTGPGPGQYDYYVTFLLADLTESNPSPFIGLSRIQLGVATDVVVTAIAVSADPRVTARALYRVGGSLGQAYRVTVINDNTTTTFTDTLADAILIEEDIVLEVDHDAPPAAAGIVGPYFSRILAFSSLANRNRLWWTKPDEPSYFPGSGSGIGQWVDVGDDDEDIVWVTLHPRIAVIYKQRSIWRLVGDPDTGTLEQTSTVAGLSGASAVVNAGDVDYFRGDDGIYEFNLNAATDVSPSVKPIFQGVSVEIGFGVATKSGSGDRGLFTALGYANGRLFVSYTDGGFGPIGNNSAMLVWHRATQRWGAMLLNTNSASTLDPAFSAFLYASPFLLGSSGNSVVLMDQTDATLDFDINPLALVWQSGYIDCGAPEVTKVLLELVLDVEMNLHGGSDQLAVTVEYDNGSRAAEVVAASVTINGRGKIHIPFAEDPDLPGRRVVNFSVKIGGAATSPVTLHSLFVYYYLEARPALVVASTPLYLGAGKLVQTKELQLSIDTSGGAASVEWWSDLPGNSMAARDTKTIPVSAGQRNFQSPFSATVEGRMFLLRVTALSAAFRLYGAQVLARVIGVFVEAYEAGLGFVWDSMEQDFSSGLTHIPRGLGIALYMNPIKRARELEFQIDTVGPVTVKLLSDLPGNTPLAGDAMEVRYQTTINTGNVGWMTIKLPLPPNVEGRLWRLQLSGASQYKLYQAALEILPIGVYVEAYEAATGAVFDSREMDFNTPKAKEAREIELDIETSGAVVVTLYSDLPTLTMAVCFTGAASTNGRQKIPLPLTTASGGFPEGRLFRLVVSGANAFRLYGARLKLRPFGTYLTVDEATGNALWDSTQLDLGSQKAKQYRALEVEMWSYGPATLTLYLDLFGNTPAVAITLAIDTSVQGRRTVQVPLPQQPNYPYARLMRATITSATAFKLFGARVNYREVGTLVEAYEAQGGALWDSTPLDLGVERDKVFDEVRFEMDADGAVLIRVYTDLPGETLTQRFSETVSTVGFGRRWVTLELPDDCQGRLIQVIVSSTAGFRLFQGQASFRTIGRYLAVNVPDAYRTLDQDFGTERVKQFKKLEVDVQTDGPLTLTLWTNQSGVMAPVYTQTINTSGERVPLKFTMPPNVRGRLCRLQIGGPSSGRLYEARVWTRPVNEPQAQWTWQNFPVEDSDALPQWAKLPVSPTSAEFSWADLPVEPTTPEWGFLPFPVAPTDAQWNWAKFFGIDDTADKWTLIDIPVDVQQGP